MKAWLLFSILATVLWGFWGFFAKLSARSVGPEKLLLLATAGNLLVYPVYLALYWRHLSFSFAKPDQWFAVVSGSVSAVAALFFYFAFTRGEASKIVAITATYPILTVLLALIFLGEQMSPVKCTGIAFAVFGVILISI